MIYLDHAATTPVPKAVADAMYTVLTEEFGNPSAQYPMGQEMHRRVDAWRAVIAGAVGCEAKQLYFTSCGTESDNWAIRAACWQNRHTGRHIVTTAVEHHAVLNCCQQLEQEGWEVTRILPDRNGDISTEAVLAAVRPDTALVSVMMVNNELGNIYPIADIARGLKAVNDKTLLHTDAVQGFLKIPFSARTLGADFITLSGHKIGAPKGIGALYIGPRVRNPRPLLPGGGQERGLRSGTEPVFLAAGFARAVELAQAEHEETLTHVRALSLQIRAELARLVPDAIVNSPEDASPFIVSVSVPGLRNAKSVAYLSDRGVYVSRASACESNHEHVAAGTWRKKHPLSLQAAGIPLSQGNTTLRVSFSGATTPDDVDCFVATLAECNAELGSRK